MRTFDVECPNCGRLNRDLLLEDSGGWMECESCGCISRVRYRERLMCLRPDGKGRPEEARRMRAEAV
ncbi:MAG: translation initiation factor 2 [Firmicutes bacterium]|nr:translation initiation factor 2 [Bacillota bacterium]